MGFSEDRAQGRFSSLYLLIADNPYILWDAEESWKAVWRREVGHEISVPVFTAPNLNLQVLLGIGATISMFENIQPVIIRSVERVHKDRQDEFLRILKQTSASTKWLLTAESIDKRTTFYKSLSSLGSVELFPTIYADKLTGWVQRIAGDLDASLAPAVIVRLAATHGTDLFAIRQTIERALLYIGRKRRIELADIEIVLAGDGDHDVYQLLEAAAGRDFASALRMARSLWAGGNKLPLWLTAIHMQCLQYLRILEMGDKSNDEIGRTLGVHPFRIGKLREPAKAFGEMRLLAGVEAVLVADWDTKTSTMSPAMAWELLVWRLCDISSPRRQTLLDPFRRRMTE